MKCILVGLCNKVNENVQRVKAWALSFKRHCSHGKIVLLCAGSTRKEMDECRKFGIETIPVCVKSELTINHQRLLHIDEYLSQEIGGDIFLITDVFDVIFQKNPFEACDIHNYEIFVSEEGVDVNQEPWNSKNIHDLFPDAIDICLRHPIVCSGVIGGKRDALSRLYERMYVMCEHESTNAQNIRDQAALIVLLSKGEVPKVKIFQLEEGWAVHCAVAGPTEFFEKWGFKSKLHKKNIPIPYMESGVVKTRGNPYAIVHQYNRVSEWSQALIKQYI
jgi:hypothetical protein